MPVTNIILPLSLFSHSQSHSLFFFFFFWGVGTDGGIILRYLLFHVQTSTTKPDSNF